MERALKILSFILGQYTLLFLWILFLETENKVSMETKMACVLILYVVTERKTDNQTG